MKTSHCIDCNDHGDPIEWCREFTITDKDREIRTFMHYTDSDAELRDPVTVFGKAKPGLFYNYNDELYSRKWTEGWRARGQDMQEEHCPLV